MGKNVLLILPAGRFDDHIYEKTRQILERYGHKVSVASSVKRPIFGLKGQRAMVDLLISEIKLEDFEVIILVGGIGAKEYWDSEILFQLLREADEKKKILGAIANTPILLARAGVLKGRKATVLYFESKELKERGADYTSEPVTIDGNIITAKEAAVTDRFGLALVKMLKEENEQKS